jgi:hypothetical protein
MNKRDLDPRPREQRTIGRKVFLTRAAALTLAGGTVAGAIYEVWRTWQALHPQPFPYDRQLSATATAAEGLETTLKAEAPFTPEMIRQVLTNTGMVILTLNDGPPVIRSAWLAKGPGEGYNIVTSAHDAPGPDTILPNGKSTAIKTVSFIRPYIDTSFLEVEASKCTIAVGRSKDIPEDVTLIIVPMVDFPLKQDPPPDGVAFQDSYVPKIGDRVLFAGYPTQFEDHPSFLRSKTYGDVARVTNTSPPNQWRIEGLASPGASGSPVFAVFSEQLTGVGVISARNLYSEELVVSSLALNKLRNSIVP